MTVTVNHAKTNAISDWTQAQLDEQIALGNFAEGTVLADIVLPSDWNNDHTLTGVGTMAEQNANSVAITGGTINNTSIGATTASTGKFTSVTTPSVTATTLDLALNSLSTGSVNFNSAGGQLFKIADGGAYGGYWTAYSASGSPSLRAIGSVSGAIDTNSAVPIQFRTNIGTSGAEQLRVSHTASAVNYVQVTGSTTGLSPTISVQGSDSSANLDITAKNAGNISLRAAGGTNFEARYTATTPLNFLSATGSVANFTPVLSTRGSDTNIALALQSKGTGAIDLAAGSSGVNISNGGTVTAITRTAGGSGYATAPTVTISPPTTAGGVQATATCTVTAGAVNTTFTITNAGSGYIEQPTITFSGGGGSGAAAYATVGSATTIRSLGSTLSLNTPAGESVRILDAGATAVNFVALAGTGTGASPYVRSAGSDTNIPFLVGSKGTSPIQIYTNSLAQEQFRVSHTASAVNYVQVTGAATTAFPIISSQGSDTNAGLIITSKGTGNIPIKSNNNGNIQLNISGANASVNYLQVAGNIASNAPILSAQGTDTNIDLALTPKGTGNVRFGTHTATADVAISGYIEIKDSGGTLRKLAVIT